MKFRKDINGLRAFAVIAVVLFHFNAAWMPGGFAGVDVFFVISGFLMTSIIFRGIEQQDFSIAKFYIARGNRIIPALALLCVVLLVFGWFYLTPLEYKALGKHAARTIGFVSNHTYLKEAGYFEAASHEKWLLHSWSLSVEWQFYIIYPLILLGLRKLVSLNTMKLLLVFGTIVGFIYCVFVSYSTPNAAYYLLPARAWEMMIGGVAYLYPFKLSEPRKKGLELLGLALIIGSCFWISAENAWPGYLALFPVLGSFFIIQAQRNDSLLTGNFVFQKIGAWSYSIYLWHWPIVVFIYRASLDSFYIYLGMGLSIFLGYLSYKYVERAKLASYSQWKNLWRVKPLYILLATFALGTLIYKSEGADIDRRAGANSEQAKFLDYYTTQHQNLDETYWLKCNSYSALEETGTTDIDPSCITKKGHGGIFLWGDSHAEALSFGLRELAEAQNIPFYQKTSAGCIVSLSETDKQTGLGKKACDSSNKLALQSIKKLNPTLVVIAQANSHEEQDWQQISAKVASIADTKIIVVGPVSQWQPSLPDIMIKPKNWKSKPQMIADNGLDLDMIATDQIMKSRNENGYKYISLIDQLCEEHKDEEVYYCKVLADDGELLQVDYGHLSKSGSLLVVNEILAEPLLNLYNK
ncbi:acyltransferase family protein [Psychrobacter jeotgali]|uniref:acyltransferase family protein n=1 Tax=Psychrobacter jeotgali TaxID=179010 RepID=UPI00191A8480|nr:acyltransferase family protein [Psychrobacter jeotgali]